jgi:endonuclease G
MPVKSSPPSARIKKKTKLDGRIDGDYSDRKGYDSEFLGNKTVVPLPTVTGQTIESLAINQKPAAKNSNTVPPYMLPYHHFSIAFNESRKIAQFTACNIDGPLEVDVARADDKWSYDPRIPQSVQVGDAFYKKSPFDRGHLVRRLEPVYGDKKDSLSANFDTFHFTNCSPQQHQFNERAEYWAGLENYILENAKSNKKKVILFTGPVLRSSDKIYREVQIPRQFWKVAVILKSNGMLSATAYVVSQEKLLPSVLEKEFVYGAYKTYQVSIEQLENMTGLNFGQLSHFDPLTNKPGKTLTAKALVKTVQEIKKYKDITL